jgi:hypothetical protein
VINSEPISGLPHHEVYFGAELIHPTAGHKIAEPVRSNAPTEGVATCVAMCVSLTDPLRVGAKLPDLAGQPGDRQRVGEGTAFFFAELPDPGCNPRTRFAPAFEPKDRNPIRVPEDTTVD